MEKREPGQRLQTEPGSRRREQGRQGPASSSKSKGQRGPGRVGKDTGWAATVGGGQGLA